MKYYTLNFREFTDVAEKMWALQDAMGIERTSFSFGGFRSNAYVFIRDDSVGEKMFDHMLDQLSIVHTAEPYELSCERITFLLTSYGYSEDYQLYASDAGIALLPDTYLRRKEHEIKLQNYQHALAKDFSVSIFYPVLLITAL